VGNLSFGPFRVRKTKEIPSIFKDVYIPSISSSLGGAGDASGNKIALSRREPVIAVTLLLRYQPHPKSEGSQNSNI
jgi:hypothetical protein